MRTSDLRLSSEISGCGEQAGNDPTVGVTSNFASPYAIAPDRAGPRRTPLPESATGSRTCARAPDPHYRCSSKSDRDVPVLQTPAWHGRAAGAGPTMQKRALPHGPLLRSGFGTSLG